ncbi:MAG: autotransporter-associated beta strand repeat-containing protein, partial [bacterium]
SPYAADSGSGYDQLMSDVYTGIAPWVTTVLRFDNLTLGQIYTAVIYTKVGAWPGRPQNATFANGTDTWQLLNTDPGNVGYYSYCFKASGTTATITMVPLTAGTFHWFGASLEAVINATKLAIGDANDYTFSGVISGITTLVKQGSGKQTLAGANTYSGATTVSEGMLEITVANALPVGTALEIATGATLKLSNPSEQTVSTLTFDGVPRYRGTWGGPASIAQYRSSLFAGTGMLRVLTGPVPPGTLITIF